MLKIVKDQIVSIKILNRCPIHKEWITWAERNQEPQMSVSNGEKIEKVIMNQIEHQGMDIDNKITLQSANNILKV